MEGFLEEGGLEILLKGVESVSKKRSLQLADAMILLECVSCVKCVMNSKTGLNVITQHKDYVQILVKGKSFGRFFCRWDYTGVNEKIDLVEYEKRISY
jgi:Diaphanous GTPase-binding Domain